jgi:flagellar motor component MotA
MKPTKLPIFLLALDGLGTVLLVLGLLGMIGMDIGLRVLTTIWPVMIIIGAGLMAPFVVWAVRQALEARKNGM